MPKTDSPRVDPRNYQQLLEDAECIVPLYTPEWNIADEKDTGYALLRIFTHMQEEIVNRLNCVPDKNFTAFLEMLGIRLMPARPARVPVTFYLPERLSGGVFVPARTQVATEKTEKNGALTYETVNGLFATSAALYEIYCVDPKKDEIFWYSNNIRENKEFRIFTGKNLQEHVMYLGHDDLFKLEKPAEIKLIIELESGSIEELKNMTWEYWGDDEEKPKRFEVSEKNENDIIILNKRQEGEIKKKKINGIESHWIHCRFNKPIVIKKIKIKDVTSASIEPGIKPDICFYNFIPIDCCTGKKFYPFGKQPRLFDTFYIASREAFSKKKATIKINFERTNENAPIPNNIELSWEYWNGTLWQPLGITDNNNTINKFELKKTNQCYNGFIKFDCKKDLKETEVNGEKNYWIRVRLINGDYGKEEFTKEKGENKWIVTPNFNQPIITNIGIEYSFNNSGEIDLQYCIAKNNLEFQDFTHKIKENTRFKPFIPLQEEQTTLYLGFNDAFRKGNISIFFSLPEEINHLEVKPKIHWTYWSKASNLETASFERIKLISTEGIAIGTELLFEESSGIETISESAMVKSLSGKEIILDNRLDNTYTTAANVLKRTHLEVTDNTKYLTKSETLEFIGPATQSKTPAFGKESFWLMGTFVQSKKTETLIKGIYPNTIWAKQIETIDDEILGSGDGEKKHFKFIRSPVMSPEIWLIEGKLISREEKEALLKDDIPIREVPDETGKIMETWVRWKAVEDFIDSRPRSRHYIIDHAIGQVQFGDGTKGMIPPIGKNNIRANYKSGGGVNGNIMKHEINVLKSPIARIDRVINHEPAEGGSDTELLEEVLERGPHVIKHRDKAVTVEDFERIAREASNYIARTKCSIEGSTIKIIIIPKSEDDRPQPSPGLTKTVRDHLLKRSLNSILSRSLEVTGPCYNEVKVTVDVFPESIDDVIHLEKMIIKRLKEYLHPLTGGPENRGWEFGRGVHISDVYSMLEAIDAVDHVENLTLNCAPEDIKIQKSENVSSGEHRITMKLRS